mmetsp:Transcript_73244/g.136879  ORF Transcript_73244/g.136879 Transcript_73244/m.136879 type:complete len:124 (+) Transcript_73244:80-451(+)
MEAARRERVRRDKLVSKGLDLCNSLKRACEAEERRGKKSLTWGAVLPAITPGNGEEMDEILGFFAAFITGTDRGGAVGFSTVEWFNATPPTTWQAEPVRNFGHVHLRVTWADQGIRLFDAPPE